MHVAWMLGLQRFASYWVLAGEQKATKICVSPLWQGPGLARSGKGASTSPSSSWSMRSALRWLGARHRKFRDSPTGNPLGDF